MANIKNPFKFGDTLLIQKIADYNCRGCFFEAIQENTTSMKSKDYPCCTKEDGEFLYPCRRNIIFVEKV